VKKALSHKTSIFYHERLAIAYAAHLLNQQCMQVKIYYIFWIGLGDFAAFN